MALSDWYITNINTTGTVVVGDSYEGTHYLSLTTGVSGNNYDGIYSLFPTNTGSCVLTGGSVSWAVKNKVSHSTFGPIIRCTAPAMSGMGYFVNVNTSYLPDGRSIEIHKGYELDSATTILQTSTMISGGVSGSWYEYKADFYSDVGTLTNVHIDVYTNEGTRDLPIWELKLQWSNITGYAPNYTGLLCKNNNQTYVQRVAGTGTGGNTDNANGVLATFYNPMSVMYNDTINKFIIADYGYGIIRHMDPRPPHAITTSAAWITESPISMCTLGANIWVLATDGIYQYNPSTQVATLRASVVSVYGTDICTDGTNLFFTNGAYIKRMLPGSPYTITTVAGSGTLSDVDGTGTGASIYNAKGITYCGGNFYFVTSGNGSATGFGRLRKMTPAYVITTLAGGTVTSNDSLCNTPGLGNVSYPISLTWIGNSKFLIGCETQNIKMYDMNTTMLSTLSGNGAITNTNGAAFSASFGIAYHSKTDLAYLRRNGVYFPSMNGHTIWRHPIDFQSEVVFGAGTPVTDAVGVTSAGTGRSAVVLESLRGMRYYNGYLYYIDTTGVVLFRINVKTWQSEILAGVPNSVGHTDGTGTSARFNTPNGITVYNGVVYIGEFQYLRAYDISTRQVSTMATLLGSTCLSVVATATDLYASWTDATIRQLPITGGASTVIIGNSGTGGILDGDGTAALMSYPEFSNNSYDTVNNTLYFADNHSIRKVTLVAPYTVTTIAGSGVWDSGAGSYVDGTGSVARFNWPQDLVLDSSVANLYIVDTENSRLRKLTLPGCVASSFTYPSTYLVGYMREHQISAGWRVNTHLWRPTALAIAGNHLYISQYANVIDMLLDDGGQDVSVDFLKIKKYL